MMTAFWKGSLEANVSDQSTLEWFRTFGRQCQMMEFCAWTTAFTRSGFARNYRAHGPNTVLLDNALATMGAGLPSAMAAHLVYPERQVLAVCGDGGFMMNSQELETAIRMNMNLTCLIVNDGSYGMIRWKQADMGFKDWGLTYGNPDFIQYARSYGAHGHRVESAESLLPLLKHCLSSPGVNIVDCPVDYAANTEFLSTYIKEKSATIQF